MPRRTAGCAAIACCLTASAAAAATEARLIRVDARSTEGDQTPLFTTLIDVGDLGPGGFEARELPADATLLLEGAARPAELVDRTLWSTHTEPGFGTAWLVVLDSDRRMGPGLARAKEVALELLSSLRPGDAIDVVVVDDRQIVADTGWRDTTARAAVADSIRGVSLGGAQRNRGCESASTQCTWSAGDCRAWPPPQRSRCGSSSPAPAARVVTLRARRAWPRWLPRLLGALVATALVGGWWALRRR